MYGNTDTYTTINDTWEISRKTGYFLRNIDVGIWEFTGTGYCVDDMQMTWTDELQMMMSCQSRTSQLHKQITQPNRTKQDDITSRNGNDK